MDVQQAQARLQADKNVARLYAIYKANPSSMNFGAYLEAVKPYLAGIDQNKFGIDPSTGQINNTSNYGHAWKMAAGMAAGVAPYLLVPGATAAGTAGAASTIPATAGPSAADITAASAGGGGVVGPSGGGTVATGLGGKIWQAIGGLGGLINTGATIVGEELNRNAINKATQAEVDAANKALALQGRIYDTGQQNLAPYMQAGAGAAGRLNYLLGGTGSFGEMSNPTHAGGAAPSLTAGAQPLPPNSGGWTSMRPGSPITPAIETVKMQAPDGSTQFIPQDQVPHYTGRGARVVQ